MANVIPKPEKWLSEKKKVFESLFALPQTRLQVAVKTHAPIQNVCRYVGQFRKAGKLIVLRKDRCPISKMKAEVITTNPAYQERKQLTMFQ